MLGRWIGALVAALLTTLLVAGPARADSLDPPVLVSPGPGDAVQANPTFKWEPVERASKYHIQVSTSPTFSTITYEKDVSGTSATPTTELPLGALYWHVLTYDGGNVKGTYSSTQSFVRNQPDAPQLIGPTDATAYAYPQAPVLSWQHVAGIKQYTVEVDDEATFTGATEYSTAGTSLALPDAQPSATPRYWRVQGVTTNGAVTTAWSVSRTFTIGWPNAVRPMPLTPADDINADRDEIVFSWTSVAGAAKYQLQYATNEEFTTKVVTQVTGATRYRPRSALDRDQYYWRVRALAPNGDPTAYSDIWHFKRVWLDGALEARPTVTLDADTDPLVAGGQFDTDRIALSWSALPRASYYEIQIAKADSSFSPQNTKTCRTPNTQWTPYLSGTYTETPTGGLFGRCDTSNFFAPGSAYFVRVRGVDVLPFGGPLFSLWSNAARAGESVPAATSFTLAVTPHADATAADAPGQILSSPDSEGTPKLTWRPVTGAVAYRVLMARDQSFTTRVVDHFFTTNTEFVVNQPLADNSAGLPFFWLVLPCTRLASTTDYDCLGEEQAINQTGQFASFDKLSKAVGGTTGAGQQTDTVALSWQDQLQTSPTGGGIKWYQLEVSNAGVVVETVMTDALGYTPTDKSYAEGQYSWRVRAIDASGTPLAWSAAKTFEKSSSAPVPEVPAASTGLPVLRWAPTAFADAYDVEVYRGTDTQFPLGNRELTLSALEYPAATLINALAAGTYSWRVRQVDAYGKPGPWSTEVQSFTIGGVEPALTAPGDAAAAPLPSLVFKWDAVPGSVRYRFQSSDTPGFGTIKEAVDTVVASYAPVAATTATYVGGTTYYWRVSVLDGADNVLAVSDVRSFTAQTAPPAPTVSMVRNGADINVSWTPAATSGGSAVTGSLLRYRESSAATWTEVTTAADVQAFALDDLKPNTRYEAQVAAVNAIGTGPFSTLRSATTPTVPATPTNLTLRPEDQSLVATWSQPSSALPITGYAVRWAPSAGGAQQETTVTTLTATITGLQDATEYTVEVAAFSDIGRGPFASGAGTTLPPPPQPDTTIASGPAEGAEVNTDAPSFAFTGARAVAFECSVDGGNFATCTSPKQLQALSEGQHTFAVRSVDSRGRLDDSPAQRAFTVDLTAPDTQVGSGPSQQTQATTAAFAYSGIPAAASFECSLDGAAFAACAAGGKTYSGMSPGQHTFTVRALDAAGNADATPASWTWTVVPAPPDTIITAGPAPGATIAAPSVTFAFSGSPSGSVAGFECKLDDGSFGACTSPHELTALGEGPHTFAMRSVDAYGQPDPSPVQRSFAIDTTAPDTAVDSGPADQTRDTTANFTYSAPGAARFECKLDDTSFASCPASGKTYSGLAVGAHVFTVRGIDAASNADATPATFAWTIAGSGATPSPTPTATPAPDATTRCRVPRLKGKTRAAARRALLRAHCRLGRVRGPRGGRVKSQSVRPGAVAAEGKRVGVRLRAG